MSLAETIYHHSPHLPEPAAREVLDFIQFIEQRYGEVATGTHPAILTPEQTAAYRSDMPKKALIYQHQSHC